MVFRYNFCTLRRSGGTRQWISQSHRPRQHSLLSCCGPWNLSVTNLSSLCRQTTTLRGTPSLQNYEGRALWELWGRGEFGISLNTRQLKCSSRFISYTRLPLWLSRHFECLMRCCKMLVLPKTHAQTNTYKWRSNTVQIWKHRTIGILRTTVNNFEEKMDNCQC